MLGLYVILAVGPILVLATGQPCALACAAHVGWRQSVQRSAPLCATWVTLQALHLLPAAAGSDHNSRDTDLREALPSPPPKRFGTAQTLLLPNP
eukprot:3041792-Amphidinium_carterae.1